MSTRTDCRRGLDRHPLPRADDRCIELEHPRPRGHRYRFPLHDVSLSGLSFELNEMLPGVEEGSSLDGVVVQVGACVLHGDLLVMHVTPEMSPGAICGALFYPATDEDLIKLKSLVAGLQAARPQ